MKGISYSVVSAMLTFTACVCHAQGGGMGGGMGFGGGGQAQYMERTTQALQSRLDSYLNGQETPSILTPGEFVEWKLKMKAGQVVIAESRSDSFDPALQIVDGSGKILAFNDDRYPGDQRPLLLWRCTRDGEYLLHVRSFRDKFGGQCYTRYRVFDSVDASAEHTVEVPMQDRDGFLVRLDMTAGELVELSGRPFSVAAVIAPDGLPNPDMAAGIRAAVSSRLIFAPVAGAYYAYCNRLEGTDKFTINERQLTPKTLATELGAMPNVSVGQAPTRSPAVWKVPVKAGQVLEISLAGLKPDCNLDFTEAPDTSKFDLTKDDQNPFFPKASTEPEKAPLFTRLPGRDRDNRIAVVAANRNGEMWVATNGDGPKGTDFHIRVAPAAVSYGSDAPVQAKLAIADTDYWQFEAAPGDVLTLTASTSAFTPELSLRGPDMDEFKHEEAEPDQTALDWRVVIRTPGRYLESIAARGNGGSGSYALVRRVIHPKPFGLGSPAEAEIQSGDVQVWKLTATPDKPLLVHWTSTSWNVDTEIYDERGEEEGGFDLRDVDGHNRFGILKVDKPTTFLLVLSGHGGKTSYSISVSPIPGYKSG